MKKKQQQLQADQNTLNDKWVAVLAAEQDFELRRADPNRDYPKRRLLPAFDDEAAEEVPFKHDQPDRPPRGRDRAAGKTKDPPVVPRRTGKEPVQPNEPYDLRKKLSAKSAPTRSIYGSRGHAPAGQDGYQAWLDRHDRAREDTYARMSNEVRQNAARVRGAAHPMCFTDEVMQHQFPEGFKPVNIEQYDGTTDPAVWIEDFLLHIHMARGDDLHAIKYLPLKLKGPARHWLNSLPENSIGSWEELEDAFRANFQGTYVRPPDADDLSHVVQQPGESARQFWNRFLTKKNQIVDCPDAEAIAAFKHSIRDEWLTRSSAKISREQCRPSLL